MLHQVGVSFDLADNINADLIEVGWEGADWVGLVQDRDSWRSVVNAVMNLRI